MGILEKKRFKSEHLFVLDFLLFSQLFFEVEGIKQDLSRKIGGFVLLGYMAHHKVYIHI